MKKDPVQATLRTELTCRWGVPDICVITKPSFAAVIHNGSAWHQCSCQAGQTAAATWQRRPVKLEGLCKAVTPEADVHGIAYKAASASFGHLDKFVTH